MYSRFTVLLEERFNVEPQYARQGLHYVLLLCLALIFVLCCTVIVGFDDVFVGLNSAANLTVGSVPSEDIIAREEGSFISEILTEQERQNAVQQIPAVFDPPDPNVARQQRELTEKLLAYIDNVRGDSFASLEQQTADINQITSLILENDQGAIVAMLQLPEDSWSLVGNEIISVLERVMRDSIRETDLNNVREQLPSQVSLRLSPQESQIVTMITADVIRANTFENPEQTAIDQQEALDLVEPQQRHFIAGQIVASANQPIDILSYEALQELGLLGQTSNRGSRILRALVASTLVILMIGLYVSRFENQLIRSDTKTLLWMAVLFLIALAAVRAFGTSNIYLMPTAALGILYLAISRPNLAIVATIGFAFLAGLLGRSPSLEIASLIAAGNICAILTLRNAARLNSYFLSGFLVGITNVAVVAIFALLIGFEAINLTHLAQALVNGILIVPTTSFAAMFAMTVLLNLATPFKLMDLSQPSKPLLQRLLREAPGTYQHSLQVANLAEQAAESIGADTQMTHVAALYHDIGKMSNPFFFTENQQHIRNPHDALNDPYRSADIIIDHVIEGGQIAKKYNLPHRIREFVREHHGTTQVFVFYKRALDAAEQAEEVDPEDFSYPGPIPQSRETAILMLADSCESAIRAVKPESNRDITSLVHSIIEDKRNAGQLNASNLTLNEIKEIEETFIDVFKGLFHTRIDYAKAVNHPPPGRPREEAVVLSNAGKAIDVVDPVIVGAADSLVNDSASESSQTEHRAAIKAVASSSSNSGTSLRPAPPAAEDGELPAILDDDEPLVEVPPLPKRNGTKNHVVQASDTPEEAESRT